MTKPATWAARALATLLIGGAGAAGLMVHITPDPVRKGPSASVAPEKEEPLKSYEKPEVVREKPRETPQPGRVIIVGPSRTVIPAPFPDCKPKEILDKSKYRCYPDPAFIPVSLPEESVRLVNANIKFDEKEWEQDLDLIYAARPDFITLQEMSSRTLDGMARSNYSVYSKEGGTYERETPVLWDNVRWEALETGTRQLSFRNVKWGLRFANWVTLRSRTTGRTVSIISVHSAPTVSFTQGLLRPYVDGLKDLSRELREKGEVLIAGDLNVSYQSNLYRQAGLDEGALLPTYDVLGRIATHDGGGTIDYMLSYRSDTLAPTSQGSWAQASDHHATWSDWTLSSRGKVLPAKLKLATLAHDEIPITWDFD